MTKELRRLSIIVLIMFIALFTSTSVIHVFQSESLAENPRNTRALYDSYEVQRGSIIAGGTAIATSVASPDIYSFQRVYTDAEMWSAVTGFMNPTTGTSTGIEQSMNSVLAGTGSGQFFARVERIISGQPPRGSNVVLSLEPAVQRAAYEAMDGLQGAVVAIEPKTGRILAMVSTPGFDTNTLAVHDNTAATENYTTLEQLAGKPLLNKAIGGDMNPPGSTFKLVVASAALSSGRYTPQSTMPNVASYTLPGTTTAIRNAGGGACGEGETVTIADALRLSCNIPFAELAVALGTKAIREEAEKFGFNQAFEIPLATTPSSYPSGLDPAQTALTGFGQGKLIASPLQMAMVSAGIANDGVVMTPRMIDQVLGPDLSVQQTFDDTEFGRAMTDDVAAQMQAMMVANVAEGVASGARIDGVEVAGKTGTAENGSSRPYTLWYTGFAPADDPQVAVAVVVENGGGQGQSGSGNVIAAPVAKKVIEAVLNR